MPFSSKKRAQSRLLIDSNGTDDNRTLGEALHQSTKTKIKKNKRYQSLDSPKITTQSLDLQSTYLSKSSTYRDRCPCQEHYNKQLLENSYQIPVDQLFDSIFGSNQFVQDYHKAQRFYDETATSWLMNEATNHRERTLKYKVPYESTFFGKGTILTREKQALIFEVPGSHYTLETEVYNEGVKFSDTFTLTIRYCLVQISHLTTNLRVTAHIFFNKSVNSMIKPLIERNAYSASQEGLKDLNNRLNEIEKYKNEKRRLSQTESLMTSIPSTNVIRRQSQDHSIRIRRSSISLSSSNNRSTDSDRLLYILIFLVILLLILHVYLYAKLKRASFILDKLAQFLKI